jgi:DNA-nicking Smr family endonuclease
VTEGNPNDPIQVPITGTLDLHGFNPSEVKELVAEYIEACIEKGILHGRIIHGKGIGTLREVVHSQLRKNPMVKTFAQGDESSGGWGATRFTLD